MTDITLKNEKIGDNTFSCEEYILFTADTDGTCVCTANLSTWNCISMIAMNMGEFFKELNTKGALVAQAFAIGLLLSAGRGCRNEVSRWLSDVDRDGVRCSPDNGNVYGQYTIPLSVASDDLKKLFKDPEDGK